MGCDKGFSYLDTFSDVRAWDESHVDALQRSNTPHFARPAHADQDSHNPKIMIVHDYSGGYGDYEACQGTIVEEESYSCDFLQYVSTFVYFSHKLVVIPPPTWVNTCHRNGVKVLGTFLVESGSTQVERLLESDGDGRFWVAEKLAKMARIYGFDGWLINIEKSFPILRWSSSRLEAFLRQLREQLSKDCELVWYDALTTLNIVWYQNTLNSWNLQFALAAGSILTNYAWTPELASRARQLAIDSGLGLNNLYFGIDVWAQNSQTGRRRRVTWPRHGGGGTGTGFGVSELAKLQLNAGIFAPGWSFEHFQRHCLDVERSVWTGASLPSSLSCECHTDAHTCVPYQKYPISKSIRASPAGTSTFFHTDFRRGFHRDSPSGSLFSHIGAQSVMPIVVTHASQDARTSPAEMPNLNRLSTILHNDPPRLLVTSETSFKVTPRDRAAPGLKLRLFELGICHMRYVNVNVKYRSLAMPNTLCLFFDLSNDSKNPLIIRLTGDVGVITTCKQILEVKDPATVITAVGVAIQDEALTLLDAERTDRLELFEITVKPIARQPPRCKLEGLHLQGERLTWNIVSDDESDWKKSTLPLSEITGPCAYFDVSVGEKHARRAYALEFVLCGNCERSASSREAVRITVTGFSFDGVELASAAVHLYLSGESDADNRVVINTT